jgi:hypothetical protein
MTNEKRIKIAKKNAEKLCRNLIEVIYSEQIPTEQKRTLRESIKGQYDILIGKIDSLKNDVGIYINKRKIGKNLFNSNHKS